MNVAELIAALSRVEDQSAPLISDGCDCYGSTTGVYVVDGEVHIAREDVDLTLKYPPTPYL